MSLRLLFESGESSLDVRRFVVQEAVSSLFRVTVWAHSPESSLPLSSLVGHAAGLRIESPVKFALKPVRLWSGICSAAAQVHAENSPLLSTYEFEIVPALWLLTKRSGYRIFQHLSIPDIIDKLLGEWKIAPVWEVDRGRYPKLEFKVQYGESDFTLFTRLLEEAGITYLFEDTEQETKLVLRDEPQTVARRGVAIPYQEHANHAEEKEYVNSARIGHEVRPGAFVLQDYDFRRPALPLQEQAPKSAAPEDRNEQVRYEPGSYLAEIGAGGDTPVADDKGIARYDMGYGRNKATRLLAGARVGKAGVTLDTNAVDLRPGSIFEVSNHVHPDVAGRALLTTHLTMEGSLREAWRLTVHAVWAELPYRPPAVTPKPAVHGIQSATVVGENDAQGAQEIHVDEFGRVRVQFPWDREAKADANASCWIRVSQGWAGRGYGMMHIPRVGQEVLVTFLDGDPDQPVIVGRLHNKTNPLFYKLPDNKTISTYKGDSSPGDNGYNEIKFEDKKGEELFYHQAEKDQRVLVKHDETITVLNNRRKAVNQNETDTTGKNRVEVTGRDRSESVGVNKTTFVVGNRSKWIKRDKGVRNEGNRQTLLNQTADIVVKGDKREWVQRDAHLYIKGDRREAVDDTRSFIVVEDHHEKIGGSHALVSGKTQSYHADVKLVAEGGSGATAKGPGGFVAIDASGVIISGNVVRINAGGSPGQSKQATPKEPLKARELRQPDVRQGLEDAGANEDVSGFNKTLAALGKLANEKPSAGGKRWARSVKFEGVNVFQRDDLFDPDARDKRGRTNRSRMAQGLAPIGKDGKSVNLHHLIQSEKGSIAEVADTFHKKYDRIIHINPKTTPSGIDRKKFNAWKRGYWKQRAAGLPADRPRAVRDDLPPPGGGA
jgi:type VI secretion system secreted protein VgrG